MTTYIAIPSSFVLQPGIELSVNEKGQVIHVEPLNVAASEILGDLQLLHLSAKTAVVLTVQRMQRLGHSFGSECIE